MFAPGYKHWIGIFTETHGLCQGIKRSSSSNIPAMGRDVFHWLLHLVLLDQGRYEKACSYFWYFLSGLCRQHLKGIISLCALCFLQARWRVFYSRPMEEISWNSSRNCAAYFSKLNWGQLFCSLERDAGEPRFLSTTAELLDTACLLTVWRHEDVFMLDACVTHSASTIFSRQTNIDLLVWWDNSYLMLYWDSKLKRY